MEYLITLVSLTTDQGSKEIPTSKVLIFRASVVFCVFRGCSSLICPHIFTLFNSRSFLKNSGSFYHGTLRVGTRPTPTNLFACQIKKEIIDIGLVIVICDLEFARLDSRCFVNARQVWILGIWLL